jgi:hypothetical protein
MEWRPLRRHSIHDIDTIPPDVISDHKKPSIQFCSAEKRRYESAQSIGENRENAAFRLKFTFASLNLQVNPQPWRQNSLNLQVNYHWKHGSRSGPRSSIVVNSPA